MTLMQLFKQETVMFALRDILICFLLFSFYNKPYLDQSILSGSILEAEIPVTQKSKVVINNYKTQLFKKS
uniref:Uncharacterized protein n=1 Tax=Anguilla anguilla TaxID=7936 RepID=A0A0E9Q623_ANGAN